jgi:hypothetical protein
MFNLWYWTRTIFFNWVEGWKNSLDITNKNGASTAHIDSGDLFTDILIIICIIGVFCNIAGFKKTGNKIVLGSILAALLGRVIFHAG